MPTIRQQNAFDKIVENGGNVSKAMREVGYSEETAKTPQKLTESKGWQELVEEHIPDSLLMEKHKDLLNVPKVVRRFKKGELESEYEELDSQAIKAGLDMAYKLKGHYAPEKKVNLNLNGEVNHEEIDEIVNQLNELKRKSLASDGRDSELLDQEAQNKE